MDKKTGGGAFPHERATIQLGTPGMTLRDWFAGQAIAGMLSDPKLDASAKRLAEVGYEVADAMLAERAR